MGPLLIRTVNTQSSHDVYDMGGLKRWTCVLITMKVWVRAYSQKYHGVCM